MISWSSLWAVARAEARQTRRLVRYWVFVALAVLVGSLGYTYYAFLHWAFSSYSATVSMLNPRFLLGGVAGIYYLMIFLFGLVFLGFDIRARDERERMAEVLDARPYSNVELLMGRWLGIVLASWVPVIVMLAAIGVAGRLIGEPLTLRALASFGVAMALPAFSFTLGLVFFLAVLLRHRALVAVASIAVIIGLYVATFALPLRWTPLVDFMGPYMVNGTFGSEVLPTVVDAEGLFQRLAIFAAGIALVWLAAALHPRRDDSPRGARAIVGGSVFAVVLAVLAYESWARNDVIAQRKAWRAVHESRRTEPVPDVTALRGTVRIDPGDELSYELEIDFRAPGSAPMGKALFSLAPGMEISRVTDAAGRTLDHVHADGLLEVTLAEPATADREQTIALAAAGVPDKQFGYVDSVVEPLERSPIEGQIFILGWESVVFDSRYVALLPGSRWLPGSGTEFGRGDARIHPDDFYAVDLTVEVPGGWLVAGPGKRQDATSSGGGATFRFAPPAPVPDVALVAGKFESVATDAGGVRLELLLHRSHGRNVEVFDDAGKAIHEWFESKLGEARDVGISYPYDGLTLVESPQVLRGYGGGWRLGSTMAQPGLLLMRESSFPTAKFSKRFEDPEDFDDAEGGIAGAKLRVLETFFENDFTGGNPFLGGSRSFLLYQTAGRGEVGIPLDFVWEYLLSRLITEKQGYFSAHVFDSDLESVIGESVQRLLTGQSQGSISQAVMEVVTSKIDVWDALLKVSLADLDPWKDPQLALDVLTLKGDAMARSLLDDLGKKKTGELLGALRARTTGKTYTRDDVLAAAEAVGADLSGWLDLWIDGTELPGFTVGDVQYERLPDSDDGTPRYQLSIPVRNDEPAPGLVRFEWRVKEEDPLDHGDPVRVEGRSAILFGIVTSAPPKLVRVVPYLSLNREPFAVQLPPDPERIVQREPFVGVAPLDWQPDTGVRVVVDDLDEGFEVQDSGKGPWWRAGRGSDDEVTDGGLPVAGQGVPRRWSRRSSAQAWGKYRHTTAVIRSGKGDSKAMFRAELPDTGQWELEYHVPRGDDPEGGRRFGKLQLAVVDGDDRQTVEFDAKEAESGWNSVGKFDLAARSVVVEVTNESDGRIVPADAIRWTPVRRQAGATS